MSFSIAITGKGGVGKTSLAGLLVFRLIARGKSPILAVDADPNTCLDAALGIIVEKSVGTVREEARVLAAQGLSDGISKQDLLALKISESLVEAPDFDLIAMGRPEGPGCYCYANNVLKNILVEISNHYPYVVLDNEAGLENLSRRIVQQVDLLIMVSDPSSRGLDTVERLFDLVREMDIHYDRLALVVNRLRHHILPAKVDHLQGKIQANFVFGLKNDPDLAACAERGAGLDNLPADNDVVREIDRLLDEVLT